MHYRAGVISFSLCGQRLVYLAERTARLAAVSSRVQMKSEGTRTSV